MGRVREVSTAVLAVMAAAIVLAATSCGAADEPAAAPRSSTTVADRTTASTSTTSTTTTTTIPVPVDPAPPSDPAGLGPCSELDPHLDVNLPAEWLPGSVPDGLQVLEAYTTKFWDRAVDPQTGERTVLGWRTTLYETDDDGRIVHGVTVTTFPPSGQVTPDPSGTTLRGQPGWIGPAVSRSGPTGGSTANWVEGGTGYRVEAGLDEVALREFIEGGRFSPTSVSDPTGRFRVVASGPDDIAGRTTTVGLGTPDQLAAPPVQVIVERARDGQTGPATHGSVVLGVDPVVGTIDGRLAITGTSEDGRVAISTTTRGGDPIRVIGPLGVEQLTGLVTSIGRIEPDDPRLVGVRIGAASSGIFAWCREDR